MGLRATLLAAAAAIAMVTAILLATQQWGLGQRDDGSPRWKYVLEDVHDRNVYVQRGRWLPAERTPYLEEHSEYPQVATWVLGVPYLFFDHHLEPGTEPSVEALRADFEPYGQVFHVLMGLAHLGLIAVTALSLRRLGRTPAWALLLLLPGSLYFGFNRYDALPALMVALALLLQLGDRPRSAALALGLGAMTKWYPILLLPLFASYNVHRARAAAQAAGTPFRLMPALLRGVVAPGLVAGLMCLAILGLTWVWDGGGWDAVRYVYAHHMGRNPNPSSWVSALTEPGRWGWLPLESRDGLGKLSFLLQVLPAALIGLAPIRDRETLVRGALAVVLAFVAFSKVFSPQWVVWIAPLAILVAPGHRPVLVLLVVFELLVYLQMPVMYYEAIRPPRAFEPRFWLVSDTRILWLFTFWAWSSWAFLRTVWAGAPAASPEP